jgi:broad specificity polyphosphatase/5'/3'-nucleotidase SurE
MEQIINNKSDKQKLLQIYIPLIKQNNYSNIDYNEIIQQLKTNFNQDFELSDLVTYYEPYYWEEVLDLKQQMYNLDIRYE